MRCYEVKVKKGISVSRLENVDYALNPYIGCSHKCLYCYSPYVIKKDPNLFWENIGVKINLPLILQSEIKKIFGRIFIGSVTDPYQPCESKYLITRHALEILIKNKKSFTILTKSNLILRDNDLFETYPNAEAGLTINTLDENKKRILEINSPPPNTLIEVLGKLKARKYVMIAPVYNNIENELEEMLEIFLKNGVEYVLVDKFRYRIGMPRDINKYFLNENKIKEIVKKISTKVELPIYLSF